MGLVGAVAAFGSSVTWAFASVRYSQVSRELGSVRVNLARASVVGPFYLVVALALHGPNFAATISVGPALWLVLSVLCSYVIADGLFFSAARRVGIATALSIASTYPLWAVLVGVVFRGESFGAMRAIGTLLCVVGVATLVRLAPTTVTVDGQPSAGAGIALALLTSLLWAGNSISIKYGSVGLDVVQINGVRYGFALVVLAIGAWRFGGPAKISKRHWIALLPAVAADGLLGSSMYVYGLAHSDLAIGATLSSLAPLISVPIALVMGEEEWNAPRIAAVTVTVTGAVTLVTAA
jgi:drug/metabolite transporter (DMT)-like permease